MKTIYFFILICSLPVLAESKLDIIRNQYDSLFNFSYINKLQLKKEIKIAIIDTGIDESNKELTSRIWLPESIQQKKAFGWDTITNSPFPHDSSGHGSHVAGIIVSIFPQAKIFPINYFSSKSSSKQNIEAWNQALKVAIDANVDLINLSGGGDEFNKEEEKLLKLAEAKGIIVISGVGNDKVKLSDKNNFFPASYKLANIISVMSHSPKNSLVNKEFLKEEKALSNFGPRVTTSAPGFDVISFSTNGQLVKMSGSSMATPVITGLIAYLKAIYPEMSLTELKTFIRLGTTIVDSFSKHNEHGGVINAEKAIFALNEYLKFKRGEFGTGLEMYNEQMKELEARREQMYKATILAKELGDIDQFSIEEADLKFSFALREVRKNKEFIVKENNEKRDELFELFFYKRNPQCLIL